MDLAKAQKIIRKNFKDYAVKSDMLDDETIITFICVDLVKEDMTVETPAPAARPASRKKNDNVAQLTIGGVEGEQK